MIYNENKQPFFVHFYIDGYTNYDYPAQMESCCASTNAETIYNASNNGIPVIGVLHKCMDEKSVRVYNIEEAEAILSPGATETFETPCIIEFSYQGAPVSFLDTDSNVTFPFARALSDWMYNNQNNNILLKLKLYNEYPYDYYTFLYNVGIERSDQIVLESATYYAVVEPRGESGSQIVDCSNLWSSEVFISQVLTTAKCELESGQYTYYAVFQFGTSDIVIQMKDDLVRFADCVDSDMLNWDNSNNDNQISL